MGAGDTVVTKTETALPSLREESDYRVVRTGRGSTVSQSPQARPPVETGAEAPQGRGVRESDVPRPGAAEGGAEATDRGRGAGLWAPVRSSTSS